jgi:hypothetical protein
VPFAINGIWPSLYGEMFSTEVRLSGKAIATGRETFKRPTAELGRLPQEAAVGAALGR